MGYWIAAGFFTTAVWVLAPFACWFFRNTRAIANWSDEAAVGYSFLIFLGGLVLGMIWPVTGFVLFWAIVCGCVWLVARPHMPKAD